MGFGVTGSSKASTWVSTTTINISIDYVCRGKVQKTMANSTPPMGSSSLIVMTTCSLRKFLAIIVACTCENF
jgi:hypothetical protein